MKTKKPTEPKLKQQFFAELNRCFPKLRKDKKFTLKDICSDSFWDSLSNSEKIQFGVMFYELVVAESFHIRFVGKNKAKGNLYCLV